jgi:type I restriction enzyme R subunit
MSTESATRKEIIDKRLRDAGWNVADRTQVVEEYFVSPDPKMPQVSGPVSGENPSTEASREFSDYVLLGRNGKPIAVVEAKKSSSNAELGREQAKQ